MTAPTVVVTGAGGFLGRALARELAGSGVNVRAVTRSAQFDIDGVQPTSANALDKKELESVFRGADAIFHLVAHVHDVVAKDDSQQQRSITHGSTIAALHAAEAANVPSFVFASSLAVFGNASGDNVNEEHVAAPTTAYGQAKLESEFAVAAFADRTGAFASSIRPAMMYGEGFPGNLARMIRAVRSGWFPPVPEFGNRRSMVWVEDAARAMVLAWRKKVTGGRAYNVTDGQGYSTRDLYDMIRSALGLGKPALTVPRTVFTAAAIAGDFTGSITGRRMVFDSVALARLAGSAHFDSSRAERELGYRPTMTLPKIMPMLVRGVR